MTVLPSKSKHHGVTARLLGEEITKTPDGSCRKWRRNGKLHRENGPAMERADGKKEWWWHGMRK